MVTPYYNKPNQRGLYAHFAAVAKATSLPIIIYNIPPRSVIDMMPETMGRLAHDFKNIVGVKDATGKVERVSEQRMACGKDFIQLSGEDASALGFNAHGGVGCISVTSNVAPRLCAEFQKASLNGDKEQGARIAGSPDAAAQGDLPRAGRFRRQICAVAAGQDRERAALAAGDGRGPRPPRRSTRR